MEIKGSGNKYYEVDLNELTCTCRDWTCRKHNFPKGDKRRLCKHLVEAMELNVLIPQPYPTKFSGELIPIDRELVKKLMIQFHNDDAIIAFSVCGEYYEGKTYQSDYLPIVIQYTYDEIPVNHIDKIFTLLGYEVNNNMTHGIHRYYDGRNPLHIIISKSNEFLFRTVYHELGRDKFLKLSSAALRKLGMKLTELGFIDKNRSLVDMDVSTEEELCDLLGIRSLAD